MYCKVWISILNATLFINMLNNKVIMGNSLIGGIIGLTVTVILVTTVLIPVIVDTNTSSWDAQTVSIFAITSLVAVAGLVYAIGNFFGFL